MELVIDLDRTNTPDVVTSAEELHPSSNIAPRHGKKPSRVNLPGYTYAELISMAIQSVPSQMMTIVEIQKYMRDNFPCFRTSYKGWHNSIRHNLSARECFYKVPLVDKRQKCRSHYWMINLNCSHCRDGNGLLQEARQWRKRRVMAKTVVRNKRRASKKNGSSMTRNADGLDHSKEEERKISRHDNHLPFQTFSPTPPLMNPMEYSQQTSPDFDTNSPQTPSYDHGTDWGFPLTYLARNQPTCLECGDDMAGDCEHCVILDVDEEPPSPMSTSNYATTRCENYPMTSQTSYHFKTYIKEEPNIEELDVKDGAVLYDVVDKQDLFQTDDNFDASVYDVEGHPPPHHHRGTIGSTSMPTSMPPSPAPSSPSQHPLDLSYQSTRCHNSPATSETLPHHIKYQPHRNGSSTSLSTFNYCRELHPNCFQDQRYSIVHHIGRSCHAEDDAKRFYRFPSDAVLRESSKRSSVAGSDVTSEHPTGCIRQREDDRRSTLNGYLIGCNDSLLIEPIHHRTISRPPTNNPAYRFTRSVDSTPVPFHRRTTPRHPLNHHATRHPAQPLVTSRTIARSNVNTLFGGRASSSDIAASNDIRAISRLGELLKVSMAIVSKNDF